MEIMQLARSHPKILVEDLPILSVVPIEVHRLKLQVSRVNNIFGTMLFSILTALQKQKS